jgi:hypothetical protein
MNSPASAGAAVSAWWQRAQVLWVLFLPVLLLGPVLFRSGYLLTFDMVWVPDLSMRPSFLGLGSGWPRAVPSDTVIALLDNLIPGMVLQKLMLYGALSAAGLGVVRLLPRGSGSQVVAAMAAATFYVWNPFVAERLTIGHWPILLGHAALPWVLVAASRIREHQSGWAALAGWLWLGSLSASAGMVTGGLALMALWRRGRLRDNLSALGLVLAANSVWIISGLMHLSLSSDPAGFRAFGARDEGGLPTPLALLSLGGIWNQLVVPGSRGGPLVWLSLLLLQLPMLLVLRHWWTQTLPWLRRTLVTGAVLGYFLATISWLMPDLLGNLASTLPPLSLLRDGSRYLGVLVLLQACLWAALASWLLSRIKETKALVAVLVILLPVLLLPDLAWGRLGLLHPVSYPKHYAQARQILERDLQQNTEPVLILPFVSYRAPAWNDHWPVLDPMGRYLTQEYFTNDALQVSGKAIHGEDPMTARIARELSREDPQDRADGLEKLGVRAIVTELDSGLPVVDVGGAPVLEDAQIRVQLLGESNTDARNASAPWRLALLGLSWMLFGCLLAASVLSALPSSWKRIRAIFH